MTDDDKTKARELIDAHVNVHKGIPHQWAGYPGLCLICYQHGLLELYREARKAHNAVMAAAISMAAEAEIGITDRPPTKYEIALNEQAEETRKAVEEADPLVLVPRLVT